MGRAGSFQEIIYYKGVFVALFFIFIFKSSSFDYFLSSGFASWLSLLKAFSLIIAPFRHLFAQSSKENKRERMHIF